MQRLKSFFTVLAELDTLLRLESYHLKYACRHRWRQEPQTSATTEGPHVRHG